MLVTNNEIFNSAAAADGAWRNISNFVAYSVQIKGIEAGSTVWIEVCNDPACVTDPSIVGMNATGNLAVKPPTGGDISGTADESELLQNLTSDGGNGQAMWCQSCLVYNYVRVRKTGGGAVTTTAYLFGQQG